MAFAGNSTESNAGSLYLMARFNRNDPIVIMHCNKALYCMRTLEFLTSRAPCVTILHHNQNYRTIFM